MSEYKYIYCNGKIYSIAEAYVVATKECFLWDSNKRVGFETIEFNNFEELIEVGDLVLIEDECTNIKDKTTFEVVTNIKEHTIETHNYYNVNEMILEIWKRLDDTFIKVGHKENGKWVID